MDKSVAALNKDEKKSSPWSMYVVKLSNIRKVAEHRSCQKWWQNRKFWDEMVERAGDYLYKLQKMITMVHFTYYVAFTELKYGSHIINA